MTRGHRFPSCIIAALVGLGAGAGAADAQTIPTLPGGSGVVKVVTGVAMDPRPAIIVGDPTIPPFPTGTGAIDSNQPDSPFAGVVSVFGAISAVNGVLGSGVALDRYHILTAAHVVDFSGGLTPEGTETGDGTPDALMPYSRVFLNEAAAPEPDRITGIQICPGWTGFRNAGAATGPSNHNDLAVLTLANPLPDSVPSYPIYRVPFESDTAKVILFSGYGGGGDEKNGVTQPANFETKRYGWNIAAVYETAPGSTKAELYLSDFDAPDLAGNPTLDHTGFDGFTSLGNGYESMIAPGDSGGPAFLIEDLNGDGFVEANELAVFGLTTFTFNTTDGNWPNFGAGFGGPILSAYSGFIDGATATPEPASMAVLGAGLVVLLRRRR